LFDLDDLKGLPLIGDIVCGVEDRYPGLEPRRLIHESIRRLIDSMVSDLLVESGARLAALAPKSADDIRFADEPVIAFGTAMERHDRALRAFLFARMYRHDDVNRETARARRIVADLFTAFMERPQLLPAEWHRAANAAESSVLARLVADYIAGMTDRYAITEHRRLFSDLWKIGSNFSSL
jgi:dGTPase